jgi:hypothetical protein
LGIPWRAPQDHPGKLNKEKLVMLEKSSWEILKDPNHILLDEDYRPMELVIYMLTWSVEIALTFTVAIVYLRG